MSCVLLIAFALVASPSPPRVVASVNGTGKVNLWCVAALQEKTTYNNTSWNRSVFCTTDSRTHVWWCASRADGRLDARWRADDIAISIWIVWLVSARRPRSRGRVMITFVSLSRFWRARPLLSRFHLLFWSRVFRFFFCCHVFREPLYCQFFRVSLCSRIFCQSNVMPFIYLLPRFHVSI